MRRLRAEPPRRRATARDFYLTHGHVARRCCRWIKQVRRAVDLVGRESVWRADREAACDGGAISAGDPTRPKRIWCLTTITARPLRNPAIAGNHLIDPDAPSVARVVYDYYGGRDRFPNISPELMAAVDQADSAQYSLEEILHPRGWVLLNFLMDSRTGLGRFRNFRISNYQLRCS